MAVVVSRVNSDFSVPVLTNLNGMWTTKIKISFTGGSVYATGGVSLGAALTNATGLQRIRQAMFTDSGGDAALANAGNVYAQAKPRWVAGTTQKLQLFAIGRATGAPGNPPAEGLEITNAVSIANATFIARIWGDM